MVGLGVRSCLEAHGLAYGLAYLVDLLAPVEEEPVQAHLDYQP